VRFGAEESEIASHGRTTCQETMYLEIGKDMGGRFIRLKALHNSRDIPVFHLLEISVPVLMGIFIFLVLLPISWRMPGKFSA